MTHVTAIIPARLASTRLPRKVLADIGGRPLVWHVWQRVRQARALTDVFVATDSDEVCQVVEGFGGQVLMTSPDCSSGTERIASVLERVTGDLVLNVQGDEPLVDPHMLDKLVYSWQQSGGDLITPIFPITETEELLNPNIVKVARAADGRALYFSRSPIPYVRDLPVERWLEQGTFWGHIGVYGYRRETLGSYPTLPVSLLETTEKLEQLRFLDAGCRIQTFETDYRPVAVDVLADLEKVRAILSI